MRPVPTSSRTRSTRAGSTPYRLAGDLRVALDGSNDRRLRPPPVETVESERVREQARHAASEPVELRERVLTQRDEDVDPQRRGEHRRQGLGERVLARVVGVIQEVLLRLVENQVDVAIRLRALERVVAAGAAIGVRPPANRRRQSARAGSSPHLEKTTTSGCSGSSRSERATAARRSEDLPTPLGPVEDGEARRDEIRDDDLALALAPEEDQRVEVRVVEGAQALVRRGRLARSRRRPAASRAARRTTADRRRASSRRTSSRTPRPAGSPSAGRPRSDTRPACLPRCG